MFGGDQNSVVLISKSTEETWPKASKEDVAERLLDKIIERFETISL